MTRKGRSVPVERGDAGDLPPALLLDLDDTIVEDSGNREAVSRYWRIACAEPAAAIGIDAEALRAAIDAYSRWYWSDPERHRVGRADLRAATAQIVDMALRSLAVADQALARRIGDRYRDLRTAGLRLLPGALESLEALRSRGVRLALITNGAASEQRAKLARFELASYFEHIQIEGEFGYGKPVLRVYEHALEALGVPATDAWMVGDNLEWDVAAPQQLGIGGIWIDVAGVGLPYSCQIMPFRIVTAIRDLVVPSARPVTY